MLSILRDCTGFCTAKNSDWSLCGHHEQFNPWTDCGPFCLGNEPDFSISGKGYSIEVGVNYTLK